MTKGLVTKSTGSWYWIKTSNNTTYQARIRGKFRLDNIKHTNPIAVGDWVDFELDKDDLAVIHKIHPRKNYIIRKSVNLSKKTHILAANVDLAFLVITVENPRTSLGFIDRFLVTAEAYDIPVLLVFNKIDVLSEEGKELHAHYSALYQSIGYATHAVSALEGTGVMELKETLSDKISLIAGHSGVGKSTLVNALSPGLDLKTKEVSTFNQKGQHTTTFAQMYPWTFGGHVIDTPGIKEFGLVDMQKEEIQDYFPEIFEHKSECKFHNCLHINEPKCAVLKAVDEGEIAFSRYENYVNFLNEIT